MIVRRGLLLACSLAATSSVVFGSSAQEIPDPRAGGPQDPSTAAAEQSPGVVRPGEFHSLAQTSWGRSKILIDVERASLPGWRKGGAVSLAVRAAVALLLVFAVVLSYASVSGGSFSHGVSWGRDQLFGAHHLSGLKLGRIRLGLGGDGAPAPTRFLAEEPGSPRGAVPKEDTGQQQLRSSGKNGKVLHEKSPSAYVPEAHGMRLVGGEAQMSPKGNAFHANSLSALVPEAHSLGLALGEVREYARGNEVHAKSLSGFMPETHVRSGEVVAPRDAGVQRSRKTNVKAEHAVDGLRRRVQMNKNRHTITGDNNLLDDDVHAARVANRQQYERAAYNLQKAASKAEVWLRRCLQRDGSVEGAPENAYQLYDQANSKLATFHLEHGHARLARQLLVKASGTMHALGGAPSWHMKLLLANAVRDEGKFDDASAAYESLLAELEEAARRDGTAPSEALPETRALALGELARAELLRGHADVARELLAWADSGLRGRPSALAVRLQGLLGIAELAGGRPDRALVAFKQALGGMGESAPGLAAATPEGQEVLLARARAHLNLGDVGPAREDISVIQGLQQELWATLLSGQNLKFFKVKKFIHPDMRLRGMMARSRLISAEMKLVEASGSLGPAAYRQTASEALGLIDEARHILGETAEFGPLPLGVGIATFAEADVLAGLAQQRSEGKEASRGLPSGGY